MRELKNLDKRQLLRGWTVVMELGPAFPPSLPEFASWCRHGHASLLPGIPAAASLESKLPANTPEDIERMRPLRDKLREVANLPPRQGVEHDPEKTEREPR